MSPYPLWLQQYFATVFRIQSIQIVGQLPHSPFRYLE